MADPAPMRDKKAGEELDDVRRDVERGSIGDQREAAGSADDLVVRTVLPGASRLSARGHISSLSCLSARLTLLREDYFAEKTSVIKLLQAHNL
jgi:hypothetical protein